MAKQKLKCWEKTGKNTFSKNGERVIVARVGDGYQAEKTMNFGPIKTINKIQRKKSQANKDAKSYMKKHDKC